MLTNASEWMKKSLKHLEFEFSKLQLGRANPSLIEDIMVESYGSMQPIKNIASTAILDSQTLSINPWDKSVIHQIAKAINDASIWLNPQTMADSILIRIPLLTEERRKEIAKIAKKLTEEAKVGLRNARWDSLKLITKAKESKEISEDAAKDLLEDLQKMVDETNKKIEELYKNKEKDIMKV